MKQKMKQKTKKYRVLTVRDTSGDQTGGSSHYVGGSEWEPATDALNGKEDEEGSRKLHKTRNQEVDVDVSSCNAQPHDKALVHYSAGEPDRYIFNYLLGFDFPFPSSSKKKIFKGLTRCTWGSKCTFSCLAFGRGRAKRRRWSRLRRWSGSKTNTISNFSFWTCFTQSNNINPFAAAGSERGNKPWAESDPWRSAICLEWSGWKEKSHKVKTMM